jgi:TPR repeat protein
MSKLLRKVKLRLTWESKYLQGEDSTARRLCSKDDSEGFILSLQKEIDQRREEIASDVEETLDRWQDEYDDGNDYSAEKFCSGKPEEWLQFLEKAIAARRTALQKVQFMCNDDDEVEGCVPAFEAGSKVPGADYDFVEHLGGGGFGQAWLVKSRRMDWQLVFKFCSPSNLISLKNEAELARQMMQQIQKDDPKRLDGFVRMLETHLDTGPYYYVEYEYVPRGNLRRYMKAMGRPFRPFEAAEIVLQIADIMAVAHTLPVPIIHRDLKPENILVHRAKPFPPQLKISDFGIGAVSFSASATARKGVRDYAKNSDLNVCTYQYASPEQIRNTSRREANDDVYALGCIFYELLTNANGDVEPPNSTGARERLGRIGMIDEQIAFLQSCVDDEKHRPRNAKVVAEEIKRLFPPLRQQVEDDIKQIAERRRKGENCRQYIGEVVGQRAKIWYEAAKQGMPEAQWLCGMCFEMNLKRKDDYKLAVDWFQAAAKQGYADAQYSLACYYRLGIGGLKKSEEESLRLLKAATERNQADALYEYGLRDRMLSLVRAAAEQGHTKAQVFCAGAVLLNRCHWPFETKIEGEGFNPAFLQVHVLTWGTNPSGGECLVWLEAAAKRGFVDAQFLFGQCYESGIKENNESLLQPDTEKAIEWYKKAAEAGHAESQFHLSECIREKLGAEVRAANDGKSKVDWKPVWSVKLNEILRWCMLAAKQGFADAQYQLWHDSWRIRWHFSYYTPDIGSVHKSEGVEWLCRAAINGHEQAIEVLTSKKEDDEDCTIPWSYPCILKTLHVLVENNDIALDSRAQAAFRLARFYNADCILTKSHTKTQQWLRKAADLGSKEALSLILAGCDLPPSKVWHWLFGDDGDAEDQFQFAQSVKNPEWFYQLAAEQGHPEAITEVAERGMDVTKAIAEMLRPIE